MEAWGGHAGGANLEELDAKAEARVLQKRYGVKAKNSISVILVIGKEENVVFIKPTLYLSTFRAAIAKAMLVDADALQTLRYKLLIGRGAPGRESMLKNNDQLEFMMTTLMNTGFKADGDMKGSGSSVMIKPKFVEDALIQTPVVQVAMTQAAAKKATAAAKGPLPPVVNAAKYLPAKGKGKELAAPATTDMTSEEIVHAIRTRIIQLYKCPICNKGNNGPPKLCYIRHSDNAHYRFTAQSEHSLVEHVVSSFYLSRTFTNCFLLD